MMCAAYAHGSLARGSYLATPDFNGTGRSSHMYAWSREGWRYLVSSTSDHDGDLWGSQWQVPKMAF